MHHDEAGLAAIVRSEQHIFALRLGHQAFEVGDICYGMPIYGYDHCATARLRPRPSYRRRRL